MKLENCLLLFKKHILFNVIQRIKNYGIKTKNKENKISNKTFQLGEIVNVKIKYCLFT